jgi:gliding motility-associated-like protein
VELKTQIGDGSYVTEDTTIVVYDAPVASFDVAPEQIYLSEQPLQCYDMSFNAEKYRWHFGDGSTSDEMSPEHTYQDTGRYDIALEVWSSKGCYDDTTMKNLVKVKQSGKIKFPSGFTPNPNGPVGGHYNKNSRKNDVFRPIAKGVEEYTLQIFNRWGVMVFESNRIDVGWDGYYRDKLAKEGVYVYKVFGRFNNGKRFEKVGDFVLIRK